MDANALIPVSRVPALTLDVVADYTCPWSFLGLRRMARALGHLRGLASGPVVRWHGFRLGRDAAAPDGAAWRRHLATRLPPGITPEFAERSLAEAGREFGIQFAFDRIRVVPDTLSAHRLTALASGAGLQQRVADAIFVAFFEHGVDIGDVAALCAIGRANGMPADLLATFEDGSGAAGAVEAEEQRLRLLGVENVPNLLLNGRVLVPGPADVDTYVTALDQAIFPAGPSPRDNPRLLN
jgi:predicted DsbA family dithiol-disulfide isomerase